MKIINIIIPILIIFLISFSVVDKAYSYQQVIKEKSILAKYLNNKKSNNKINEYNAILVVPKLKLKKGIYNKNNDLNNVNKNVTLIYPDNFNNINNHTIIIAAHSGSSLISYFHNLDILDIDDKIYLYHDNMKYIYKVIQKYEIDKNGKLQYIEDGRSLLYLTTCSENHRNKQLVIVSLLDTDNNS